MFKSRSKVVALESIPMSRLFEAGAGAVGVYVPNNEHANAIARIASNAKAVAASTKQRCIIETLTVVSGISDSDKCLTASRWVKVTVTERCSLTERGKRYVESQDDKLT